MTNTKTYENYFKGLIGAVAAGLGLKNTIMIEDGKISSGFEFRPYSDGTRCMISNLSAKEAAKLNEWAPNECIGDGYAIVFSGYGSIVTNSRKYIEFCVLGPNEKISVILHNGLVEIGQLWRVDRKGHERIAEKTVLSEKLSQIVGAYEKEHGAVNTNRISAYVIECGGETHICPRLQSVDNVLFCITRNLKEPVSVSISRREVLAIQTPKGMKYSLEKA